MKSNARTLRTRRECILTVAYVKFLKDAVVKVLVIELCFRLPMLCLCNCGSQYGSLSEIKCYWGSTMKKSEVKDKCVDYIIVRFETSGSKKEGTKDVIKKKRETKKR